MEFCDCGTLRNALREKRFINASAPMGRNVVHVLMTALDIARGAAPGGGRGAWDLLQTGTCEVAQQLTMAPVDVVCSVHTGVGCIGDRKGVLRLVHR